MYIYIYYYKTNITSNVKKINVEFRFYSSLWIPGLTETGHDGTG